MNTDRYVHPGATEYCDAMDQDGDGDALAGADCAVTNPSDASAVPFLNSEYQPAAVGIVPDITGDGTLGVSWGRTHTDDGAR